MNTLDDKQPMTSPGCKAGTRKTRPDTPEAELTDLHGVAAILGIGVRSARRLDSSGRIPQAIRIGNSKRWCIAELKEWILAKAPPRQKWESLRSKT